MLCSIGGGPANGALSMLCCVLKQFQKVPEVFVAVPLTYTHLPNDAVCCVLPEVSIPSQPCLPSYSGGCT